METEGRAGDEVIAWVLLLWVKASCKERRASPGGEGEGVSVAIEDGGAVGGTGCCTGTNTGAGAKGGGSLSSS